MSNNDVYLPSASSTESCDIIQEVRRNGSCEYVSPLRRRTECIPTKENRVHPYEGEPSASNEDFDED